MFAMPSPSLHSIYLHESKRVNGWKEFEQRLESWLTSNSLSAVENDYPLENDAKRVRYDTSHSAAYMTDPPILEETDQRQAYPCLT
jgi:hypothetical protein